MEHRWGERLPVDLPVRVSAHAFSLRDGRLTDLSVSGAHLAADIEVRPLSRIEISILWPQRLRADVAPIAAYVARKYRDGFGLEWCEFSPPGVAELLRLAVQHPYAYRRHPLPAASVTRSRLAGTLLKHPD